MFRSCEGTPSRRTRRSASGCSPPCSRSSSASRRRSEPPSTPGSPLRRASREHAGMGHSPLGLSTTQDGTTIAPASFTVAPGRRQPLRFRVLGEDGQALRSGLRGRGAAAPAPDRRPPRPDRLPAPAPGDGRRRHLERAAEGRAARCLPRLRRLPAQLPEARAGRRPARRGRFPAGALPAPAPTASTDGYDVRLERPALHAGREAALRFTVSRGGRPVREIQPYLGARGHLVALRQGDLAYLHAHPEEHEDAAGAIPFAADFLSAGAYRLFLQFKIDGVVHTAGFTVEVAP